jgi:hypothetical protein
VLLIVNETFGFDFGDMCAPFETHGPFIAPRTSFTSTWFGIVKANSTGAANVTRKNASMVFEGLPHPAIKLEVAKAGLVTAANGSTVLLALLGAWYSDTPTSPPCCNETVVAFVADPKSVDADGVPRRWTYLSQLADKRALRAALPPPTSEEGPNEAAFVTLSSGELYAVIRTDGGDGPTHPHRPFVAVRSSDHGLTWSAPAVLGQDIGSARPQVVALARDVLLVSGGRPGINVWASSDGGSAWTTYNVAEIHNSMITAAGLDPAADAFCSAFVRQSAGTELGNATWSQSSGYTGLSRINNTAALLCYDSADGASGGYPGKPPPECEKSAAAVYCMVVLVPGP